MRMAFDPDSRVADNWQGEVLVIDPSLFTLPYDEALVGALRGIGIEARLVGRSARPDEARPNVPFSRHYYRLTDNAPRRLGAFGGALKALEHCADGFRLSPGRAGPVLIHAQWLTFPLADRLAIRRWRRRGPVVVTVHDTTPFNGTPTSRFQSLGFHGALGEADRLIAHTESGVERLAESGLDRARIHCVPHGPLGTSPAAPPARDAERGAEAARARVILFGKLRPYKGIDLLLEALARLDAGDRARLEIVVAGEPLMDIAPFEERIAREGLDVELIPRRFDEAEMAALLATGDAFVFPYREIEASGVLFMVQGLGRWIVASRLGAFAEAIEDGESGRLVPPGDPAALERALREIARARPRPSRPPRVTGWAEIATATRAIYEQALRDWAR